ncbi:hypothetical protein FCU42_18370 [Vibrio parahaemolyticus]|nr:hypothetical protein [Vibrio parahaemolyticus]
MSALNYKNERAQFYIKTKGIAHVRIKQTRPRIDFLADHILLFLYFKTNIDGDSHTRWTRTFSVNRWGRSQSRTQSHVA